jgi:hypothetical protein
MYIYIHICSWYHKYYINAVFMDTMSTIYGDIMEYERFKSEVSQLSGPQGKTSKSLGKSLLFHGHLEKPELLGSKN